MSGLRTTRWSLVLAARSDGETAALALGELCRQYRPAVLAYVRAAGYADAEDLTQGFFLKLLEKRYDADADRSRGRFRSFLFTALKGYLANAHDAASAAKRGGGMRFEPLPDAATGAELRDAGRTPEREFERSYALQTVARALARLRDEVEARGRGEQYAALALFVVDPPLAGECRDLAARLGVPANTLAVSIRRWRERLHQLIRLELAETVTDRSQIDQEMRDLHSALSVRIASD